jgi:hypothetical protein
VTGSCVPRETIRKARPRPGPRVSLSNLSIYLSIYLSRQTAMISKLEVRLQSAASSARNGASAAAAGSLATSTKSVWPGALSTASNRTAHRSK